MAAIQPYLLGLAGEYRVCSELNKRGIFASVTYGNRKSADFYAIDESGNHALKIEVKTSQHRNFVTRITQRHLDTEPNAPDFWVLVSIHKSGQGKFVDRFFVLSHREICEQQEARNRIYAQKYRKRHGRTPDVAKGVDNVKVEDVERFEDEWSKIIERFKEKARR